MKGDGVLLFFTKLSLHRIQLTSKTWKHDAQTGRIAARICGLNYWLILFYDQILNIFTAPTDVFIIPKTMSSIILMIFQKFSKLFELVFGKMTKIRECSHMISTFYYILLNFITWFDVIETKITQFSFVLMRGWGFVDS